MSTLLKQLMGFNGYMEEKKDGDGAGGNEGETAEAKQARETEEARVKKEADDKAKGTKPSDNEAALLKEVMQKKEALKKAQDTLEATNAKLKEFEGVDPTAVKKLLAEQKKAEEEKLKAEGNWDRLKAQMVEAHDKEKTTLTATIETVKGENLTLNQQIAELTVGTAFGNSKFISEELVLTPNKARQVYGTHFETQGGKVVAFDKPVGSAGRTMLVDGRGEPLGFEDAVKKIVDADGDRDQILKSKLKPGAGGKPAAGPKSANTGELSSKEKIAKGMTELMARRK